MNQVLGDRYEHTAIGIEPMGKPAGHCMFVELAGAAHSQGLLAGFLFDPGLSGQTDPRSEGGTTKDAHHTTCSVAKTTPGRACGAGSIHVGVAFDCLAAGQDDANHPPAYGVGIHHPAFEQELDALLEDQVPDARFDDLHIIKAGMDMSGKGKICMAGTILHYLDDVPAAHAP